MTDSETVNEILTVFARYGFKKTSMEDIARAAGLSRQSIYNRFGSKEAVFDWAVLSFISDMLSLVTATLKAGGTDKLAPLTEVYDIWIDSQFPLWCGAGNGAEIRDLAIAAAHRASFDLEGDFANAVSEYLLDNGLVDDSTTAINKVFVLHLASSALRSTVKSAEAFSREMTRVIATTLN